MSNKKNQTKDPAAETPDTELQATETPQADTPPVETPATTPPESKPETPENTDYVCPVCKHTEGIKLGSPYQKGELTLQYVQCEKCQHFDAVVLS